MTEAPKTSPGLTTAAALGAGAAAALLFIVSSKGTMMAMLLAYLAPLPIMILTLGFGSQAGFVAACAGTLTVALASGMALDLKSADPLSVVAKVALLFAIVTAFPAWFLPRLLLMSRVRVNDAADALVPSREPTRDYFPLGMVLFLAALLSAVAVILGLFYYIVKAGSYDAAVDQLLAKATPMVKEMLGTVKNAPAEFTPEKFARALVNMMPAMAAGSTVLMLSLNLWLAGRVTQISDRLPRPWPDVAMSLRLPRLALVLLAVCLLASFLDGVVGAIANILASALSAAFILQGLATLHVVSRGWGIRPALLGTIYLAVGLFFPLPLLLFLPLGVADSAFFIRDRKFASQKPTI